jgi:hypothetical protein
MVTVLAHNGVIKTYTGIELEDLIAKLAFLLIINVFFISITIIVINVLLFVAIRTLDIATHLSPLLVMLLVNGCRFYRLGH